MTTPLTREAMEALLDDTMLKSDTASLRILTLATAILAAWDERDAVDR